MIENGRSDSSAESPKQEIKLGRVLMPQNDEGLQAVEVLGRCSKCSVTGWIDYPKKMIPVGDIDNLLAYRPVKCWCDGCKADAEFLPIAFRKYPDLPLLSKIQRGFKKGLVK